MTQSKTPLPFWQSLWFKLSAGIFLVALAAVALVAVLVNRSTTTSFARFLDAEQMTQLGRVQEVLETLYAEEGSWANAGQVLQSYRTSAGLGGLWELYDDQGVLQVALGGGSGGQGQRGQMRGVGAGGPASGAVSGRPVSLTLTAAGESVGRLEVTTPGSSMGNLPNMDQFLSATSQALWLAVLMAALLSILLGTLLARLLTRPVAQMTTAARALAGGQEPAAINIVSHDELGRLAATFNDMSSALGEAEKQRQQLLADTAHELRTPITIMQGHLEAMLDGVFEVTPENLAAVHEETLLLNRLVDDLRTLSLAEMGELPLHKKAVDAEDLLKRAVQPFQMLAETDGISLELALTAGEQLPSILVDAGRIQQVLANLLSNALRHVARRSGRIIVNAFNEGENLLVTVSDNGPGLTAEQQIKVFDRFWRSDPSRTRSEGGSGLGLAISRAIVEMHGGRIWVDSPPGEGAVFAFRLPVG